MLNLRNCTAALLLLAGLVPVEAKPTAQQLAFVVDVSGSMAEHLDKAKAFIRKTIADARAEEPEALLSVALIVYRDYASGNPVEVTELVDAEEPILAAVDKLVTSPETEDDEAGTEALSVAVKNLKWTEGLQTSKIIYLIADEAAVVHDGFDYVDRTAMAAADSGIKVQVVQAGQDSAAYFLYDIVSSNGGTEVMDLDRALE